MTTFTWPSQDCTWAMSPDALCPRRDASPRAPWMVALNWAIWLLLVVLGLPHRRHACQRACHVMRFGQPVLQPLDIVDRPADRGGVLRRGRSVARIFQRFVSVPVHWLT